MMRILFSAQNFLNEAGGAEISAQTLLKRLTVKNEVHALSRGGKGDYDWEGIHVHEISCPNNILYINLFWGGYLDKLEFKPDIVITQVNAAAPTVFWAKKNHVPSIFYVRSFEHFCLDSFRHGDVFSCGQRCWRCGSIIDRLKSPAYGLIQSRNKEALLSADIVISQTKFMREVVKHYTGRVCDVVTNPMDLRATMVEKTGDHILFINPQKHKGVRLIAELVKNMRNRTFVLAGKIDPDYDWLTKEPNVRFLGQLKDMRKAYSQAKVVLVPSDMADSSPRVVFEAMASGIPCITSNVGGAAEVGDDASIKLDRKDVEGWMNAINKLYTDNAHYLERSTASLRHAQAYELESSIESLRRLIKDRLGPDLFGALPNV